MSVLKVVATIDTPISHHGAARPEVKNSAVLDPARRASHTAGTNETRDRDGDDDPVERGQLHRAEHTRSCRPAAGHAVAAPERGGHGSKKNGRGMRGRGQGGERDG